MNHALLMAGISVLSFCLLQNNSCKEKPTTSTPAAPSATAIPSPAKTMTTNSNVSPDAATANANQNLAGTWGGLHVILEISGDSATLEFDCASGSIKDPILLDSTGHFDVVGSYNRQGPGPTRQGVKTDSDARYLGTVNGDTMNLRVQLPGSSENLEYSLTRGRQGKVTKCY